MKAINKAAQEGFMECPHFARIRDEMQREQIGIADMRRLCVRLVVLMPTYNKGDVVSKAIESVLMQRTSFAFKLVILDDGSTDNSYAVAKRYYEQYPEKIGIVRNVANAGLLRSIYYAYSLLNGIEYFCVLDADDEYTNSLKLEEAVKFLDQHVDYSMYMTNVVVRSGGEEFPIYSGQEVSFDFDYEYRKYGRGIFIQTSGTVYRNIYFREGVSSTYDKVFTCYNPEAFRADGFRYEWYLRGGKAHFENRFESVYNLSESGLWAGRTEVEQQVFSIGAYVSYAQFFDKEREFYLMTARRLYMHVIESEDSYENLPPSYKDELIRLVRYLWSEDASKSMLSKRLKRICIALVPIKSWRKKLRKKYLWS